MSNEKEIVSEAKEIVEILQLKSHAQQGQQNPSIGSRIDINKFIEHTNLNADATPEDINILCKEAEDNEFYGVCVSPEYVKLASAKLKQSPCQVVTVIGFPLGTATSDAKAAEVTACSEADEFDMVLPIGLLVDSSVDSRKKVYDDIRKVVDTAGGKPVKVILETGLLEPLQIAIGCLLAKEAGAKFVKTSTGFGPQGASVEDVWLMRECVGNSLQIKAAGGIRNYHDARILIEAGAQRIGSSQSLNIVQQNTTASNLETPKCGKNIENLKIAIEHGRSLFVYHAGQRLTTFRFYQAALAIIIAGFFGIVTKTSNIEELLKWQFGLILSGTSVVITLCFWALDRRNITLVNAEGMLLKRVEAKFACLTGIAEFNTMRFSDEIKPKLLRYRYILGTLFLLFFILGVFGAIFSFTKIQAAC